MMVSHKCIVRIARCCFILAVIIVVVTVLPFIVFNNTEEIVNAVTDYIVQNRPFERNPNAEHEIIPYPIILWWTGFTNEVGSTKWCGDARCFVTSDTNYRNHNNTKVFLFYGTDFKAGELPVPRLPHHEWGLFHEESPKNNYLFSHEEIMDLFNHTATFRRESDFPLTTQALASVESLESTKYLLSVEEKNRAMKEGHLAMLTYVHSDCDTPSDRDHFVRMLQRNIAVDSYGECEHNRNLPEHLTDPIKGMEHVDFYKHQARYKFALVMENAICNDYITEKFWRPFILGTVPVIFGAPTCRDYLPAPKSAIFVEDFPTIDALAKFLLNLNASDEEYKSYLQYKNNGVTNDKLRQEIKNREWGVDDYTRPNFVEQFECFVCRRLHENTNRKTRGEAPLMFEANKHHYGCPRPLIFSDYPKGNLTRVLGSWWDREWEDKKWVSKAVKKLLQEGQSFGPEEVSKLKNHLRDEHIS